MTAPPAGHAQAAGYRGRLLLLGGLTAIGSLGIQMIVPVLPDAAADLGVADGDMALAVTVYLFGLAGAQLIHGPLADAWGRRPVLIAGAAGFAVASLLAFAAPTLETLLAARALQAIAAAATLVAARAMVADLDPARGASAMAYLMAIVMLSPMIAPILGGAIALVAGWRATFAVLALMALLGAACAWRMATESAQRREALSLASLAAGWGALLKSPPFLRNAGAAAFTSGGIYSFLTLSPFLYTGGYGLPAAALGVHYGVVASGAGLGALAAGRIARGRPPARVLKAGAAVSLAAAIVAAAALLWGGAVWPVTAAMALYAISGGLIGPSAAIGAATAPGVRRATASSVYGTLQMLGGGLASLAAAALPHTGPVLATLLVATSTATLIVTRPLRH